VILADTINLLKAMQTKLQIEEAEICTLKQQAAAVGAIAAQHQVGTGSCVRQNQYPLAPSMFCGHHCWKVTTLLRSKQGRH
jgi:hypothetical protein